MTLVLSHLDAFNTADSSCKWDNMSFESRTRSGNELVRKVEYENGRIFGSGYKIWIGDDVGGYGNIGQVFDVFVLGVDDFGELLLLVVDCDLLFKHPHLDFLFE